jgi:hypothetical protein
VNLSISRARVNGPWVYLAVLQYNTTVVQYVTTVDQNTIGQVSWRSSAHESVVSTHNWDGNFRHLISF